MFAAVGATLCSIVSAAVPDATVVAKPAAARPHLLETPEQKELLRQMAKADLEPDRLKRCLDYPDPPGVRWKRATVIGMCHLQFDPRMTLRDISDELGRHGAKELDKRFAKLAREQKRDVTSTGLDDALNDAFSCACKEARDAANAWLLQSPRSPWARSASGIQYAAAAYAARGTEFIDKTPPERIARMQALHDKAVADLDLALTLDPDLTAASTRRVAIDRIEGRTDEAHNRMIEALRRSPYSYGLHMGAVVLAEPKWGGTPGELQAARRRTLEASAGNPMLLQVLTYLDWQSQECTDCHWDMHNYDPMMEIAPSLAVLRAAGIYEVDHNEFALGAIYLSQTLRFSPTNEVLARTKRGMARAYLGDLDAARNDAEAALAVKADFQPAMHLLSVVSAMRERAAVAGHQADAQHR
ncbi:hypothetical protein [Luteibacter sp. HA06]